MRRPTRALVLLCALSLFMAACGDGDDTGTGTGTGNGSGDGAALTVYSGRNQELVGPLLEQFTEDTGIEVEVRYGDTAEMAALILEEGANSPAEVYYGQDAGALGALSAEGRLSPLPQELLDQVDPALRSQDGRWVGTSGRARVVVYNTDRLSEADLPDSIVDFTNPEWRGRIGWAPTNGSFQAFVTALRVLEGEDGARQWLEGIQANEPVVFENNTSIVEAVAAGEVEVGLVNHYYLYRFLAEDADYSAANKFFSDGDPGALINVAGAGVVDTSDRSEDAQRFVEYLLSSSAQEYFATETFEIPLASGVEPAAELPPLDSLTLPDIDLDQLEDLDGTLSLLTETGVL
jgi:iron(III) transport system substrate-binding protein